jgi:hypothetical protein
MLAVLCAKEILEEGEELVNCPFCPYFEVRFTRGGANFLHCRRDKCLKTSCIICRKSCPSFADGYEDEEESEESLAALEKHFLCAELKEPKLILEHAVEQGLKIPCPSCHVSGMKDTNCTHMTCSNCAQVWCYFCGRKESDCDKEVPAENIYSHNADWEDKLGTRCPMYLSELSESHSWPVDEDACLELFHTLRARCFLKRAVRALGPTLCDRLDAHFSSIRSCGFSMEEIESADAQWPELCAVILHGASLTDGGP